MKLSCRSLLLWATLLHTATSTPFPSAAEMDSLQEFYLSTGGTHWTYTEQMGIPWDFDSSSNNSNPCGTVSWYGISCLVTSNASYVQELLLSSSNLTGTIPDSIGNLSMLSTLNLGSNNLHGSFPLSLGNLTQMVDFHVYDCHITGLLPLSLMNWRLLEDFFVYNNALRGTIPDYFSSWPSIAYVNIEDNYLSGTIPDSIGLATALTVLSIGENNLHGSIPSSIGNLTQLTYLAIYDCGMNGSVPESLSALANLQYLYLYENELVGTLPDLRNLTQMVVFALFNNLLTGPLPSFICQWPLLETLYLSYNELNGTIPSCAGNAVSLTYWDFEYNGISGSIPESLSNLKDLNYFYMDHNRLTGALPNSLGNWTKMFYFEVAMNYFTGTLPASFGNMVLMDVLAVRDNYLQGSIPDSVCSLIRLTEFSVYSNDMTGSIPDCISHWSILDALWLYGNQFTGSVEVMSQLPALTLIQAEMNSFTGPLPASVYSQMYSFSLEENFLTGTIPVSYTDLSLLYELFLNNNILSGTIPTGFSQLGILSDLVLYTNVLSGSIESLFNSTMQLSLSSVNFNENQLTGSIPSEVFALPQLSSLSLASNCIQTSLSDVLCSQPQLTGLVLDGLGTASSCRNYLFPKVPNSLSYLENPDLRVTGSIPSCLFGMANLQTLHLSGTIPSVDIISSNLVDMSLSHNSLSGTIPVVFQTHSWKSFDISFNCIHGVLDESYSHCTENANSSVSLQVNRLSGSIPSTLTDAVDVRLVDGNIFSCGILDRASLPSADPAANNYQCGSNSFDLSLYLFTTIAVSAIVFMASTNSWKSVFDVFESADLTQSSMKKFSCELNILLQFFAELTGIIVVVLMPLYAVLSLMYSTHTNSYAWVVSAAYLGGVTPGAILLCFFTAVLFWFVRRIKWLLRSAIVTEPDNGNDDQKTQIPSNLIIILLLVNLTSIGGINILYVYVLLNSTSQLLNFVTTVFTAAYKIVWNDLCLRLIFKKMDASISVRTSLQLLNFIVVPIVVLAVISPNCFYYVVSNTEPVSTTVSIYFCDTYYTNGSCAEHAYDTIPFSYTPPYVYNYQCTATFISDYTSVYVYMFIISGLVTPLALHIAQYWTATHTSSILVKYLPKMWRPPSHELIDGTRTIFDGNTMIMKAVTAMSLFLTFGMMVPLLAVVILFCRASQLYFLKLRLATLLNLADQSLATKYETVLSRNCVNVLASFLSSLWIIVIFAGVFYGMIVWDIVGDEAGLISAVWSLVLSALLPVLMVWSSIPCFHKNDKNMTERETTTELVIRKTFEDEVSNPIV